MNIEINHSGLGVKWEINPKDTKDVIDVTTKPSKIKPPISDYLKETKKQGENLIQTETENTTTIVYYDTWTITGYCPCSTCCGIYAYNRPLDENGNAIVYGASGNRLVSGYSCAADLPFGTLVEIEGMGVFRVDDRGVSGHHLDLYFDTHEAASSVGRQAVKVTILG